VSGDPHTVLAEVERRGVVVTGEALLTPSATRFELVVRRSGCEPELLDVPYEDVGSLVRTGARGLDVVLQRGGRVRLGFATEAEASSVEALLLARCCTLPELTRALRSLGRRRGEAAATATDADRFFEPLLAARHAAAAGGMADALRAFRGSAIAEQLERTAAAFAEAHYPERPSARRALEARLSEHLEPLAAALLDLDDAAAEVTQGTSPPVAGWREWTRRLRLVFERADECWAHLAAELAPLRERRVSAARRSR